MNKDLFEMQSIVDHFVIINKLDQTKPTFMEISGYPHFENVCSNILQFYLDPNNCHGFGTMLLSILMEIVLNKKILYFGDVIVEREYQTVKNNRIDLVIQTDEFIICIENKIFSGLYNDLVDYSKTIDEIANGRVKIKIVLSLNDEKNNIYGSDFINITYRQLFYAIEKKHR